MQPAYCDKLYCLDLHQYSKIVSLYSYQCAKHVPIFLDFELDKN